MTPAVTIDTRLIPPLERLLLGKTGFETMERFYAVPENVRRFEQWQNERKQKEANHEETHS